MANTHYETGLHVNFSSLVSRSPTLSSVQILTSAPSARDNFNLRNLERKSKIQHVVIPEQVVKLQSAKR